MNNGAVHIRPLGNRVLVKRLESPERTESGLYLRGREFPQLATVLALGPGRRTKKGAVIPIQDLRVGDMVKFLPDNPDGTFHPDKFTAEENVLMLDYGQCQIGMRTVNGEMRIWPLEKWCLIKRH